MPETDGRTLEDIELHFSDKSKKLTDWRIMKSESLEKCANANDVEKPTKVLAISNIEANNEKMFENCHKMNEMSLNNKAF